MTLFLFIRDIVYPSTKTVRNRRIAPRASSKPQRREEKRFACPSHETKVGVHDATS
jgi:hypothetical protein